MRGSCPAAGRRAPSCSPQGRAVGRPAGPAIPRPSWGSSASEGARGGVAAERSGPARARRSCRGAQLARSRAAAAPIGAAVMSAPSSCGDAERRAGSGQSGMARRRAA